MDRFTKKMDGAYYIADEAGIRKDERGYCGDAVSRLADFESFFTDLVSKQAEISAELERLRLDDKTHTIKFKQLLANKLTNNNILILLKSYGLT